MDQRLVDSGHLRLGLNRRFQIKQMLSLSVPHIAQFLHSLLVEDGSGVARQVSVVKCYSSWLTLGCIQLSSVQVNEKCHQIFHRVFPTGFSSNGLSSVCVVTRASADCMIALLTRIEREECAELEVSFEQLPP